MGFTTRFWDCCKPSCAWPGNVNGKSPTKSCNQQNQSTDSNAQSSCNGGTSFACFDLSPWAVSNTLAYGFAAFDGATCGDCYQLSFTGTSNNPTNDFGSASLCGKTMIVQIVNIGSIQPGTQFDLMVPGGGVGQNTQTCPSQWNVPASQLGDVNGGLLLTCQQQNSDYQTQLSCAKAACAKVFSGSNEATLLAGCNWQVDWLGGAANPRVSFSKVACPSAITDKSGLK